MIYVILLGYSFTYMRSVLALYNRKYSSLTLKVPLDSFLNTYIVTALCPARHCDISQLVKIIFV